MDSQQIAATLGRPLTINKLTLRNRMWMGPMAAHEPNKDGTPSEQTIAFFEARARGGVGMIIIGGFTSSRRSYEESRVRTLRFDDDRFIPGLERLAARVHALGTPIVAEIIPGFGRMGVPYKGREIISASPLNVVIPDEALPAGLRGSGGMPTPTPREATIAEIKEIEQEMIAAAVRLQRAGLDGVEVALHMSYLGASFLSPRTNWRTDEYGGSLENRARMLVNTVKGIRERVGPDFVIGLRLASNEFQPDGQGPDDYAAIAKLGESAGVDYVALAPGNYETMSRPTYDGEVVELGHAAIFKKALTAPVILTSVHDPAKSASYIADGQADGIMLARPVLADPEYPRKVMEGRTAQIVPCRRDDGCSLCGMRMTLKMPIRCVANPGMGREARKGGLAPLGRVIQAPIEQAMLKAVNSRRVMKLAMSLRKPD